MRSLNLNTLKRKRKIKDQFPAVWKESNIQLAQLLAKYKKLIISTE